MSLILNIDTSLEKAIVSIGENGVILHALSNSVQKDHASFLHTAVQTLTNQAGIQLKDMGAVAVTIGPGSYTGIRVGLAAAKGLSYALTKPLITVTTLEALAKQAITDQPQAADFYFCPLIDARRMEVFSALYDVDMQEVKPPEAIILQEDSFKEPLGKQRIIFFGSGMEKWKNICSDPNAFFAEVTDLSGGMSLLSHQKSLQKNFADIVLSSPLYVKEFFDGR